MKTGTRKLDELLRRHLDLSTVAPAKLSEASRERILRGVVNGVGEAPPEMSTGDGRAGFRPSKPFMALAAAALAASAIVFAWPLQNIGIDAQAVVEAGDGDLLEAGRRITPGAAVHTGDRGAVLTLADASRVEMRAHSELVLERAIDGVQLRLRNGGVIINAAKQRRGHLYVQTKDVVVSVTGTVFLVNAEELGSRVAVIQGEVQVQQVQQGKSAKKLLPGEQIATSPLMKPRPVPEEISWSRNAEVHIALLQQSEIRPEFEIADVHSSPPPADGRTVLQMRGGDAVRGGRYEIYNATMLDLIRTAYSIEADAVFGGPNWLASDRFDVIAKAPERAAPASTINLMLQSLLADRFKLTAHKDTKPLPAWVLSKGANPKLKPPANVDESTCRVVDNNERLSCRNVTMDAFAAWVRGRPATTLSVVNSTGIEGGWDFDVRYTFATGFGGIVKENDPFIDAFEKQVGLKLELQNIQQPVLLVENVNRIPTANVPDVETRLPPDPIEFEAASIRPCEGIDPRTTGGDIGQRFSASGQVTTGCLSLALHVANAWNLGMDFRGGPNRVMRVVQPANIEGAPKWMNSRYFNIVAKAPVSVGAAGRDVKFQAMLRNLLVKRFKMASHYEGRLVDVYTLVATKPKLKQADPSSRSACNSTGMAPAAPTVVTCRNASMLQLADELSHALAIVSTGRRVVDETGIDGAWDLMLTYRYRPMPAAATGLTTDPTGDLSIPEALEQLGLKLVEAKRVMPVFVIDHIEENPTEN